MRVHPSKLALQYLRGKRSWRAAPYYGSAPFKSVSEAAATLRRLTGQNFGTDAAAWTKWFQKNRRAYKWYAPPPPPRRVGG